MSVGRSLRRAFRSRVRASIETFFFFQAEDGIRDLTVTGVQTCALPISSTTAAASRPTTSHRAEATHRPSKKNTASEASGGVAMPPKWPIRVTASSAIKAVPVMMSRDNLGRFIRYSSGELVGWVVAQGDPSCATVLRIKLGRLVVAPTDIGELRFH